MLWHSKSLRLYGGLAFGRLHHLTSKYFISFCIVRYEDVIFQTEKVLQRVAACVSGSVRHPIRHQLKTSKLHGSRTDFVEAIIKTGDSSGRLNNMTSDDLEFARKHLDSNLMKKFHYRLP